MAKEESDINVDDSITEETPKRLSSLPFIIIIGVGACILFFLIYSIANSGIKKQQVEEKEKAVLSSTETTNSIVSSLSKNISEFDLIKEEKKESQNTANFSILDSKELKDNGDAVIADLKEKKQNIPLNLDVNTGKTVDFEPKIGKKELSEEDKLKAQLLQLKRQQFQKALTSSSLVDLSRTTVNQTEANNWNSSTFDINDEKNALANEQARIQAKILEAENALRNIAHNDGTEVINNNPFVQNSPLPINIANNGSYDPQNDGISGNAVGEGYNKFNRQGNWTLNDRLTAPLTEFCVRAGWVIPATLISGINSDIPGQIIAQVSENIYDTATGKYLLIPQGTRLVGAYSSQVTYGQERLMVAWQRLVFPDSRVLDLGSMPGADMGGYSGFTDQVNNHWWKLLSSAFLMSGITATIAVATDDEDDNNNDDNNSTSVSDELRQALAMQFGNVIASVIERNLNIAPTIEIRPGYKFNVVVTKDLNFDKQYQLFDY